jgi:hypothetical protein
VALREQYETALNARKSGMETTGALRAARNLAKEDFLDVYAAVAHRVRAAYPRDRRMHDLFFDNVRSSPELEDVEEEDVEEPGEESAAPKPG